MASDDVQTNLRIPAALKDALTAAANQNNRSLSAEVVFRLVHSFSQDASLLQAGERSEMLSEQRSLQMLAATMEAGIHVQKAAIEMHRDRARRDSDSWTREEKAAHAEAERNLKEVLEKSELQIADVRGRLGEIERDLTLPDWPDELISLANKMPR